LYGAGLLFVYTYKRLWQSAAESGLRHSSVIRVSRVEEPLRLVNFEPRLYNSYEHQEH